MIVVDDREDSMLAAHIRSWGLDCEVARLDYGDVSFSGNGPQGPLSIGIERKKPPDLIASMLDRRLSGHQLLNMRRAYDLCYLLIEGYWRPSESGSIETLSHGSWSPLYHSRQAISYRQLCAYLTSLSLRGGVRLWRTGSLVESAQWLVGEWHWWNDKAWHEHHAHDVIYTPDPASQFTGRAVIYNKPPGLVEKFASILPHCDRRSWMIGRYFSSIRDAVNGSKRDWMKALEIKRGTKIVSDIQKALDGELDNWNQNLK